jgi:hypothetical protein
VKIVDFYEVNYENAGNSNYISSDEEQEVTNSLLGNYRQEQYRETYSDLEPISKSDQDTVSDPDSPIANSPELEPEHNYDPDSEQDTEFEMKMTMRISRMSPDVKFSINDREASESSEHTTNSIIINSYKDDPIERIPAPSPELNNLDLEYP